MSSRLARSEAAAVNVPQVADLIKMDRLNRLNRVVNEVAEERAQRFAGRDLEVGTPLSLTIHNHLLAASCLCEGPCEMTC